MIEWSEEYETIGQEVVEELFPNLKDTRIAWLISDNPKRKGNKLVCADCRTVSEQYKWCCDYDFIITVYEKNTEYFDDQQKRILMEHELLHCGFVGDTLTIKEHDIEEFKQIISKYGADWNESNDFDFDIDL